MLVKIVKQTRHNDSPAMPGDFINVNAVTAERWIKHGIAEPTGEESTVSSEEVFPDDAPQGMPEDVPLEQYTIAVLKGMLDKAGERIPHKAKKQQLVDMIKAVRNRTQGEEGEE